VLTRATVILEVAFVRNDFSYVAVANTSSTGRLITATDRRGQREVDRVDGRCLRTSDSA